MATPLCSECQSAEVRPSRNTYPQDKERTAEGAGSFWRCASCGARFFGPVASAPKAKRRHRSQAQGSWAALDRKVQLDRAFKRWVFPFLVILSTIFVVIYLLDRRDPPQDQIILPDQ